MRKKYSAVGFYILKLFFRTYLSVKVDLIGERIISPLNVWRPKYEAPILAEIIKNIDTKRTDRNVNIQDIGLKSLTRFHTGDIFPGNLDHQ